LGRRYISVEGWGLVLLESNLVVDCRKRDSVARKRNEEERRSKLQWQWRWHQSPGYLQLIPFTFLIPLCLLQTDT
jgi:hypothetical protein